MRILSRSICAAVVLATLLAAARASAQDRPSSTVGMPAVIRDLVLPAPELEAAPRKPEDPVVVRILATYPHGTAFRYDIEFWGQEPGEHDLAGYLRPKPGAQGAGGQASALPPILVEVRSLLPPGQVEPHAPVPGALPALGGYSTLGIVAGVLWLVGLFAILFVGRGKRRAQAESARPPSLAERLRPLVERALGGELTRQDRAALELGLVAYWRQRLGLEGETPAAALAQMREHDEAGPLLTSLEEWLHNPAPARAVDLAELLAPYRDLPADAIELPMEPEAEVAG
ncbi:MAG: hypothetical protein E2O39_16470 [Planctomycetota bacterium]|nr:MAG: hypothetical protein E2O39_16470 [Planctomycetota bacterium]